MTDPDTLQINAWLTGDGSAGGATGAVSDRIDDWAVRAGGSLAPNEVLFAEERDEGDWRQVGWGVLLPDDEALDDDARAEAADAPEAVRRLIEARRGAVLRYRPELGSAHLLLCERGQPPRKVAPVGGDVGGGPRQVPKYLLIVGSPEQVPWRVQYVLNPTLYVGRLDLDEEGLTHYVDALLGEWADSPVSRRSVLIWTVDLGQDDITWTMRHGLAEPLHRSFDDDTDIHRLTHLARDRATADNLVDALVTNRPGLVVTTSHGDTPVALSPDALRAALGWPVDQDGAALTPDAIAAWQPGGAIWYAHACCSAGSDATTLYDDVAESGSSIDRVLSGVSAAGSWSAELPRRLLGGPSPVRAFVGHVEPTFNWTLRDPDTGQLLTSSLRSALYGGLYKEHGEPVGQALHRHFSPIGGYWSQWNQSRLRVNRGEDDAYRVARHARLAALDRQSVVILGDPTVTVPQN